MQGHVAVRTFAINPALERTAVESFGASAERGKVFGHRFRFQHGRGHDDLEHRTGCQLRLDGAVQQGFIGVLVHFFPLLVADADGEDVRVESRMAGECQHFTGARIERHHGPVLGAKRSFSHHLQVVIDGQLDRLAGHRVFLLQPSNFAADAVYDHAARPVHAHQRVVVLPLQSGFSGNVAGAQHPVAVFDVLLGNLAHVTDGVGHESARRVAAAVHHQHFQYRQVGAMRFDERDVCLRCFRLDDDGVESRLPAGVFDLLLQIFERNLQAFGDLVHVLGNQLHIVTQQQHAERWIVVHQHVAIAVEHAPARRDDGNRAHAITFGQLRIVGVIQDLQFPETEQQKRNHPHKRVGDDCQTARGQPVISPYPVAHANYASAPLKPAKHLAACPLVCRKDCGLILNSDFAYFSRSRRAGERDQTAHQRCKLLLSYHLRGFRASWRCSK